MAQILDGNKIASQIKNEVAEIIKIQSLKPILSVILVGDNPASEVYVGKKRQVCSDVGIESRLIRVSKHVEVSALEEIIKSENQSDTNGILLQLPLPPHLNPFYFFDKIDPLKDVDVLHPENVGLLVQGRPRYRPCTPHGIQQVLVRNGIDLAGQHVVVISRSNIVGKPLSSMLIQEEANYANATVTVCHDKTPFDNLKKISKSADIVVVAVGKPGFLTKDMVKEDGIVIDVGITRVGKKILGDVHSSVWEIAKLVTPVPGGIGPATVSMLMYNTLQATVNSNIG